MEHDGGQLVHREVDVSIDRQAGKSTLFLVAIVHRMLWRRGQWLTYTSASRLAARRKLLRVWWPIIRASPVGHMFNATRGTGSETLECVNESTLILLSGDEASGHGDSIDASFLDEAWSLTEAAEQAVKPAMLTRPNAQLWVASTAGTDKSTYWRSKVDAGRTSAEVGVTDGPCFVEWAAPPRSTSPTRPPGRGSCRRLGGPSSRRRSPPTWPRCRCRSGNGPAATSGRMSSLEGWRLIPRDVWEASRL